MHWPRMMIYICPEEDNLSASNAGRWALLPSRGAAGSLNLMPGTWIRIGAAGFPEKRSESISCQEDAA